MLRKIFEKLLKQLEARVDIVKLSVIERTSLIMGFTMFLCLAAMMSAAVVIFLGVALSISLGNVLGNPAYGYLITAGIYLVFLFVCLMLKKHIINIIAGIFIDLFTHDLDKRAKQEKDE